MFTRKTLASIAGASLALAIVSQPMVQADDLWTTDVDAAIAKAKSENKDVLMSFIGSDWCGWCIRLNQEVFDQDTFKSQAPQDFVMVTLDFPESIQLPPNVEQQNQTWAEKLDIQGFPSIVLLDTEGRPYALTGYQEGGADAYLAHLKELQQARVDRDTAFDAAANASGIEKATLLDEGLSNVPDEFLVTFYKPQIEAIITADATNEAGLKEKYEQVLKEAELLEEIMLAIELAQAGDMETAKAKINALLDDDSLSTTHRQGVTMIKAQLALEAGDMEEANKIMQEAIDLDPESEMSQQIRAFQQQIQAFMQMQQDNP